MDDVVKMQPPGPKESILQERLETDTVTLKTPDCTCMRLLGHRTKGPLYTWGSGWHLKGQLGPAGELRVITPGRMSVFSQSPGQLGSFTLIMKVPCGKLQSLFARCWIPCPEHAVSSDGPLKLGCYLTHRLPTGGCLKDVDSDLLP